MSNAPKGSLFSQQRNPNKVNVNEEMDNVEVRWMFHPDPLGPHEATVEPSPGVFRTVRGRHAYTVVVRSTKFPSSKFMGEISPEDATNIPKMRRNIAILAGALTETMNERLHDNVDPSLVARTAVQAFLEMVSDQKRAILGETH